jgi:hypothetical protein
MVIIQTRPKQTLGSDTDFTPTNVFATPDWVLVARDGSNPTVWSASRPQRLTPLHGGEEMMPSELSDTIQQKSPLTTSPPSYASE